MSTNKSESRLLGTKDLAQRMGRTPRYVQQLAADKIIPSIRLPGRDPLFDWERVMTALSRFEVKEVGV